MSPNGHTPRPLPWENEQEVVRFTTPEQIEVSYRVAPLGSRLVAALVDIILIHILIAAITIGAIAFGFSLSTTPEVAVYLVAGYLLLLFILKFLYFVWAEVRYEGRTVGKKMLRIRSVLISGHGLTFGASLVRNLARIVDHIPITWIVPVVTKGHRRIGDLLAGTLVINEDARDSALTPVTRQASYRDLEARLFNFTQDTERRLVPDDLNLIEHLFHRAASVGDTGRREDLFLSVARKYVDRLELHEQQVEVETEPRRFLEEMYLFLRDRFDEESL